MNNNNEVMSGNAERKIRYDSKIVRWRYVRMEKYVRDDKIKFMPQVLLLQVRWE